MALGRGINGDIETPLLSVMHKSFKYFTLGDLVWVSLPLNGNELGLAGFDTSSSREAGPSECHKGLPSFDVVRNSAGMDETRRHF